jgi:hypothetical protein
MSDVRTLEREQEGAAERLLGLVLNSSDHLWHNRPGVDVEGRWYPATQRHRGSGRPVRPGLFMPAAVRMYQQLIAIYGLDTDLMAHFASYAMRETEWRDLKVACAALMLTQPHSGQPVRDDDGTVAFYDDDYRAIGEAMVLWYEQGSTRMMSPKMVLRIGQFLAVPEIALVNRQAGFADPAGRKAPLGRWPKASREWLQIRERNLPMLEGLVAAGYKETIKSLARKVGYRPESERFFELLGWPQKQSSAGHRQIGLDGLQLRKQQRFDGLDEREICERIVREKLGYKETVGRLPADVPLSPAIMAALLPSLSDRDLRIMTPTLESLGLLEDAEVRARWERAVQAATDQRSLNVAKNVRSQEVRQKLEGAADAAARAAIEEAAAERIHVFFLIDCSGSMEGAIETSKEVLVKILAGFPQDRLWIVAFNTEGRVIRLKAATRAGVEHAVGPLRAGGGTLYYSALAALRREGVALPEGAKTLLIAIGDEAGEQGGDFAREARTMGLVPDAIALIVNVKHPGYGRGDTLRMASRALRAPFSEVSIDMFDDPYHVTRVLRTLMEAPVAPGTGWLERVYVTPLLEKPA